MQRCGYKDLWFLIRLLICANHQPPLCAAGRHLQVVLNRQRKEGELARERIMGTCGYKDLFFLFGMIITGRMRRVLAGNFVKHRSANSCVTLKRALRVFVCCAKCV